MTWVALGIILTLAGLHVLGRIQQQDATRRAQERKMQLDSEMAEMVQRWRERGLV